MAITSFEFTGKRATVEPRGRDQVDVNIDGISINDIIDVVGQDELLDAIGSDACCKHFGLCEDEE